MEIKKIEKNRRKEENIRRLKNNKGIRSEHNWENIEEWKSRIKQEEGQIRRNFKEEKNQEKIGKIREYIRKQEK